MFMTPIDSNESTHAAIKATLKTIKPIRESPETRIKTLITSALSAVHPLSLNMKLIIFSLCLLIGSAVAEFEKFKKCDDSNFCQRCRDPSQSEYNYVGSSRKTETTLTSFEIVNTESVTFVVTLRAVEVSCCVIE